jgi:hypothetical protein
VIELALEGAVRVYVFVSPGQAAVGPPMRQPASSGAMSTCLEHELEHPLGATMVKPMSREPVASLATLKERFCESVPLIPVRNPLALPVMVQA